MWKVTHHCDAALLVETAFAKLTDRRIQRVGHDAVLLQELDGR